VAGDTVFVVDTGGQLMAITRRDGKIQWTARLPGATTWSGPVLAGNRLWLVSSKGQLVNVEAHTGKVVGTQDLGQPVFVGPVVAGSRMFVLTDKARLVTLN
jgi:outer membrane protein assembly factor BamB